LRVFSNTAMSADGKIGTHLHDHVAIGSPEDRRHMSRLRAQADAVVVGGKTFRNWPLPLVEDPAHLEGPPPERRRPILNAVLTRRGVAAALARRFPDPRVELRVYGPPELDVDAHVARGAQVFRRAEPDLRWVLAELEAAGCRSVLVEGGGDLLFGALQDDLLDELHLTVCPWIIGGVNAPTPADGVGFSAATMRRLSLQGMVRIGEEVYLSYAVRRTDPLGEGSGP
jgi:riboflavin-specific deaminase-like protein